MTCDEFKHDLHRYYTDQFEPSRLDRLEEHRAGCAECDRLMRVAAEMTCKELTELLDDYVEGTLPASQRRVFDRHLSICSDCRAFLESYRATMKMSAMAIKQAMDKLSEGLPAELLEVILAAREAEESDAD